MCADALGGGENVNSKVNLEGVRAQNSTSRVPSGTLEQFSVSALRTEIGDEFGYSKETVRNMIAIGKIPSAQICALEEFGITALQSLLPLRIGNINSKTGEDNIINNVNAHKIDNLESNRR